MELTKNLIERYKDWNFYRESTKFYKNREKDAKNAMNLANHPNLNLEFPEDKYVVGYAVGLNDLSKMVYSIRNGEFQVKERSCRGHSTGKGFGNFFSYSVEKDGKLIAVAGLYNGSDDFFKDTQGVDFYSPLLRKETSVKEGALEEIKDLDLRKFISNFYGVWKAGRDEK
jgi:hypothetical protein